MTPDLLFVYGTLRRGAWRGGERNPFALRLEAEARWLGPARTPGRLYQVNVEYPGMVAPENESEWVTGEVWQFHHQELWKVLDDYEGVEYVRVLCRVTWRDGTESDSWVYRYASKITSAMAIVAV